jgi:CRP/FNR family transcriptional regulator, dissimilatory nitrate respiration regulator
MMNPLHNKIQGSGVEIERMLAPYFVRTLYKAGHLLWREGETGRMMVSIKKGKVKIFRSLPYGRQASIYIFGPGETFGFLPFLDGSPYPASAEILEDTDALVMTRDKLHEAMKKDPEVAVFLLGQLAKRLRGAFDKIERLSVRGVLPRVAAALVSLSARPGEQEALEIVTLPVSSREYAALIGLTPESFSRGVTRLADMGIIHRLRGNAFQILAPDRLYKESVSEI